MDFARIYDLLTEKLQLWFEELIRMLPNLALAALVLVIGIFIAKSIRKIFSRLINRFSSYLTLNNLIVSFIYILSIGIVLFIALSILKLDKAVTSILAGAGIIGLALAFAFQDLAANFISGVLISIRKPLTVGDIVKVSGYMGKVETISLRDTVIREFSGQQIIIPNKDIIQNPIENFSSSGKRRLDLPVGISYGDDLEKVEQVALAAVDQLEGRSMGDKVNFYFTGFGDSSINFELRIWLQSPEQNVYNTARSLAVMQVKQAFDENDITIPFPIRTLDFGIKGGKELSGMLAEK